MPTYHCNQPASLSTVDSIIYNRFLDNHDSRESTGLVCENQWYRRKIYSKESLHESRRRDEEDFLHGEIAMQRKRNDERANLASISILAIG